MGRDSRRRCWHIEAICKQLPCMNRGWAPGFGLRDWGCSHTQGHCMPALWCPGSGMPFGCLRRRPCLFRHKETCSFGLDLPMPIQRDKEQDQAEGYQSVQESEMRQVPGRIGCSHILHLHGKPRRCSRSPSCPQRICSHQCTAVRCSPQAYWSLWRIGTAAGDE